MRILGVEITKYYHPLFGYVYRCYSTKDGNVAHCMNLWEVLQFMVE